MDGETVAVARLDGCPVLCLAQVDAWSRDGRCLPVDTADAAAEAVSFAFNLSMRDARLVEPVCPVAGLWLVPVSQVAVWSGVHYDRFSGYQVTIETS